MPKGRLEAFSDGVIAILITIMVLELKAPKGDSWASLGEEHLPGMFLAYVLSFIFLGIYWNNHHHMLHAVERTNGAVLWANLHLLFWLSLVPVTTHWVGEGLYPVPTAVYGIVFICAALAYTILQITIIRCNGRSSRLAAAVGSDTKGKVSVGLYALGIAIAFVSPVVSVALYVVVAVIWLIPDRRIERTLASERK
jgi:uncharacterized membrane protein